MMRQASAGAAAAAAAADSDDSIDEKNVVSVAGAGRCSVTSPRRAAC